MSKKLRAIVSPSAYGPTEDTSPAGPREVVERAKEWRLGWDEHDAGMD
jgi:hypothetical protein